MDLLSLVCGLSQGDVTGIFGGSASIPCPSKKGADSGRPSAQGHVPRQGVSQGRHGRRLQQGAQGHDVEASGMREHLAAVPFASREVSEGGGLADIRSGTEGDQIRSLVVSR